MFPHSSINTILSYMANFIREDNDDALDPGARHINNFEESGLIWVFMANYMDIYANYGYLWVNIWVYES